MFANANYRITQANHQGTTLVELILAMTFGLLIISLLWSMHLASQQNWRLQQALYHLQDNASSALSILESEITKAGHIGCAALTNDFPLISDPPGLLTVQNKLTSSNHEFTVRYADLPAATLNRMNEDRSILYVDGAVHFAAKNWLMIADCQHAEIFQIEKSVIRHHQQALHLSHSLHSQFSAGAEVGKFKINRYFIAKTKRRNQDNLPIYALFMTDINHRKIELVENIQQMQISIDRGLMLDLEVIAPPLKKHWYGWANYAK